MSLATFFKKYLQSEKPAAQCLGCGDCCRSFGGHLNASRSDLARWQQLGREDLLAGVNRLGWIWVDPATKKRLPSCPHLEESAEGKAHCAIHSIKPDMCRSYPTLAHHKRCLRGVFLGLTGWLCGELPMALLAPIGLELQLLL